ncbi:hypothetical protein [Chitinophaga sp. RAB17]|uniref:hypothetical protein n=1 Tax=Chitinophaga sp. RAB17 TaxID=3233049 RepID=UPI003F92D338
MKTLLYIAICLLPLAMSAQRRTPPTKNNMMNTDKLTNETVKKAITALQAGDKNAWYTLFTPGPELFDDGNKIDFKSFSEGALGHERFTSIDKVENNGLDLYGKFHSDKWGDFKTYFKFQLNKEGKISRLEIGQASY